MNFDITCVSMTVLYEKLLDWKTNSNGKKAILVEGARRIGKSTV